MIAGAERILARVEQDQNPLILVLHQEREDGRNPADNGDPPPMNHLSGRPGEEHRGDAREGEEQRGPESGCSRITTTGTPIIRPAGQIAAGW
jgi:hypothetical protein